MALRIKKKKSGYGSGSSLVGTQDQSWAQVPQVTQPTGLGMRISVPQAPAPVTTDSTLEGTYANIDQTYNNKVADFRQQAGDLRRQYGFLEDPSNPYGFGGVDASNPFSKASLLQKSYQTAQKGYGNSYAARGLGTSGAARAAQQYATNQYQQGYNSLTGDLGSNLGQLGRNERDIGTWREGARNDAYGEFMARRPDPEPVPIGAPQGPSFLAVTQPQYANNPWIQRGLKGPNGETLTVDNRGTWYRDKNTGNVVWVKRNKR